jgi:hypothetical protein
MEGQAREVRGEGGDAGVEGHDKGRHNNDNNTIMMMMLPLPLPPPDDL